MIEGLRHLYLHLVSLALLPTFLNLQLGWFESIDAVLGGNNLGILGFFYLFLTFDDQIELYAGRAILSGKLKLLALFSRFAHHLMPLLLLSLLYGGGRWTVLC